MLSIFDSLREFTFLSILLRMVLAMLCGGAIGYGRTKKSRTAGFRTYMLTAIGASLSVIIAMYEYELMQTIWKDVVADVGMKFDASRFASSVIGGIGFLSAGSIIAGRHHQVEGLTTATGLFASVCMGMAAGAGFFECVTVSLILIILALEVMQPLESLYKRRKRNITLAVEFDDVQTIDTITEQIRSMKAEIMDIDIERTEKAGDLLPSAVFSVRMAKEKQSHSEMLASIAELPGVFAAEELIS